MIKTNSYYFDDLVFKFTIDDAAMARCPEWSEDSDFPPYSPRQAIQDADRLLTRMLGNVEPDFDPRFHALTLKPLGSWSGKRWYYEVSWLVWARGLIGDQSVISVPVLMSGEPLDFEVCDYDDRL